MGEYKEIKFHLKKIDDAYSKYSDKYDKTLAYDFVRYLEDNAREATMKQKIKLTFKVDNGVTEEEKESFKKTFQEYYTDEINDNKRNFKTYGLIAFTLLTIGVLFLVGLFFLPQEDSLYIIRTILEIFSWAFTWAFVDVLFFKGTIDGLKYNFFKKIKSAKIVLGGDLEVIK